MLVTCPRCESIFKLPDSTNSEMKMRCSICNNVFKLNEINVLPDDAPLPSQESPSYKIDSFKIDEGVSPKKNSVFVRIILILLFVTMGVTGALMKFTTVLDPIKGILSRDSLVAEVKQEENTTDLLDRVRQLELINVRQFVVPNSENDKFQKLTVIEGSVLNRFDTARSFIELEAALYDAEGNVLDSKVQMAGPRVSFFQLQVLGQEELEESIQDNLYILNYNTNVKTGQTVPFMFIFYNPPENAANFNVKIVNAQIPESAEGENVEKPEDTN